MEFFKLWLITKHLDFSSLFLSTTWTECGTINDYNHVCVFVNRQDFLPLVLKVTLFSVHLSTAYIRAVMLWKKIKSTLFNGL